MTALNPALRIVTATVVSFLLSLLFDGRSTAWDGAYLDALLQVRDPVPVARELLLIPDSIPTQPESPDDPGPVELIWTLAELRAERVLLPPSWEPATITETGTSGSASQISSRINREFARIDENIAELFEAIRIGSIDPTEAERFVGELRRLVANSKARIQDGLSENAGASGASVEDLIERFGNDRVGVELSELGVSLPSYPSATAKPIPPRGDEGAPEFRRLPYASLGRYISLSNRLTRRLSALEEEGYFDEADPRNRPSVVRDHVRSLRTELYEQPTVARADAWREAVDEYFEAIGRLIDADTQARLTARLEALEETENLEEEATAQIQEMQQELESAFDSVREDYAAVTAVREELTQAVGGSFVILQDGAEQAARAVVANSALVDEHLYAPVGWNRILLLTAAGFLVGLILSPFRFGVVVLLSPVGLLSAATLFPALFVLSDIWVDPASAVVVLVGATGAAILVAGLSQGRVERTLTGRAVDRLPPPLLRRATRRGGLPTKEIGRRRVAVVVVAPVGKDGSRPDELPSFHRAISKKIRHLGGAVLGEDGPTVFAVFQTPLGDRATRGTAQDADDARLAQNACAAVKELVLTPLPGGVATRCGVEVGELLFYVSPIGGYRASGRATRYARRFCDLASKHRRRALFGDSVVTACGGEEGAGRFQKAGKLTISSAGERYAFYSLKEIDPPSP